jgi:hypothetical protein
MDARTWRADQSQSAGLLFAGVSAVRVSSRRALSVLHPLARCGRSLLARVFSEPLIHFFIAGLALFAVERVYQNHADIYRIVETPEHVAQLANEYALQFGAHPSPQTLAALVRRDIGDEVLFRQGLALKLDQSDEIVRRRVIQKMQFLMQNLNPPREPTENQLQAYFDAHASRYVTSPRVSFSHVFFSADRGGEAAARARAEAVLATLSNGTTRAPTRGDPFPDLYDFSAYEPAQVFRLFGHTPLSQAAFSAPTGRWTGPLRSGVGWHLIYIDARQDAKRPSLSSIRDTVRTDYLEDAQDAANKAALDNLTKQFVVVREDRKPVP